MLFKDKKWKWAMLSRFVRLRSGEEVYVASLDEWSTKQLSSSGIDAIAFTTACGETVFANKSPETEGDENDIVSLL